MSLIVSDIVNELASADLFGTSIFNNENNITEPNRLQLKRLLLLIQQGVDMIYRRFNVKMKAVWLLPNKTQTQYLLKGQQPYLHQAYQNIDKTVKLDYPKDEYGIPILPPRKQWDDDLLKVNSVYTLHWALLPFNTPDHSRSIFLNGYDTISLYGTCCTEPLHVMYQCKAPKIIDFNTDTLLPELCLTALRYYVAKNYYLTITTNEGIKRSQYYSQEFQSAINEIEVSNYFQTDENWFDRNVLYGKWNVRR